MGEMECDDCFQSAYRLLGVIWEWPRSIEPVDGFIYGTIHPRVREFVLPGLFVVAAQHRYFATATDGIPLGTVKAQPQRYDAIVTSIDAAVQIAGWSILTRCKLAAKAQYTPTTRVAKGVTATVRFGRKIKVT
jgi:hypothetical protein